MAAPLSARPTPFLVTTPLGTYFGNCVWDALGIAAMLGHDARIDTDCADCGAAMTLEIEGGELRAEGVAHFAVPAAHGGGTTSASPERRCSPSGRKRTSCLV